MVSDMDVVILSIDALRFDCINWTQHTRFLDRYGMAEELLTPTMDSIAEDGVTFTRAISTSPETPMAHASLFTGMYPPRHGIRSFFHGKLSKTVQTIFQIFNNNGYGTICVATKPVFHDILELSRGCDQFIDDKKGDQEVFASVEKMKSTKEDLLLFHRFVDVHYPYLVSRSPPSNGYLKDSYRESKRICNQFDFKFFLDNQEATSTKAHYKQWSHILDKLEGRQSVDEVLLPLYIKGVSKFDKGRLKHYISSLKDLQILADEYLLILTADHGEGLIRAEKTVDRVKRFRHSFANLDDLVRIPLIFSSPSKLPQSEVFETQVSIIDILPTLVDLLDLSLPENGDLPQGKSLVPAVNGDSDTGSIAYSEYALWNDGRFDDVNLFKEIFSSEDEKLEYNPLFRRRSVRTPKYRYVELGRPLSDEILSKDSNIFVNELFRRVLAKWPSNHKNEIEETTARLKSGDISRGELVNEFHSDAILSNRYALFDLKTDPYEQVNLLLVNREEYDTISNKLKNKMEQISGETTTEEDFQVKKNRISDKDLYDNLKDLGYL